VRLPPAPWPEEDRAVRALVEEAFRAAYLARYSREPPSVPIELVHARAVVRGRRRAADLATAAAPGEGTAERGQREVRFGSARMAAAVYPRKGLAAGFSAPGPALVEEDGSTTVVGPEGRFTVLDNGNILVEIGR
jgi:N-methylhydantoinase A